MMIDIWIFSPEWACRQWLKCNDWFYRILFLCQFNQVRFIEICLLPNMNKSRFKQYFNVAFSIVNLWLPENIIPVIQIILSILF